MTSELPLDAETEAKHRRQAAAEGVDPVQFVVEAIQAQLKAAEQPESDQPARLSPQQRIDALHEWIAGFKKLPYEVDDSRESIYEGRGE